MSLPAHARPNPQPSTPLDIAVVGIGALLPGAHTVDGFWRNVLSGRDLMRDVPPTHWLIDDYYDPDPDVPDRTYARRGAFLDPVDFDPLAYGIPPKTLAATDTTQLLSLVAAEQALRDATGGDLSRMDRERTGVIVGTSSLELLFEMACRLQRPVWRKALREGGIEDAQAEALCERIAGQYVPWQEATFPGLLSNVVAGRIANRFDLNGPNCTVDAACAGSLAALSMAVSELQLGRCDTVLTGGADTVNGIPMYMCFSKTPALSPSGDCRPFSESADGTMLGEGIVMFALRRLADAERDGNAVYAVLKGLGSSSDGGGGAIYAPVPSGQELALHRAYQQAGYGPSTVELIEGHGTGTRAGDATETAALLSVFGADRDAVGQAPDKAGPWCAIGSVKSQIGHTKSAAGAAGLLKAVLALHHRVLPPTIKVLRPLAALSTPESPLYVNTQPRPWVRDSKHPRRASVSSFGFGGSNFHLTAEEYRPASRPRHPRRVRSVDSELILLAASTPDALAAATLRIAGSGRTPADIARESQLNFDACLPYRLAVLARTATEASERLRQAAARVTAEPDQSVALPGLMRYSGPEPIGGRLAFLFSGQGSQYVGMGAGLARRHPSALEVWDRAADWGAELGLAMHRLVFPPPAFDDAGRTRRTAVLAATENAQPALAVQSLAQLAVLRQAGLVPDCVAGHSFGELVALHAAGAYDAHSLFELAVRRGELMARAAADSPGGMLAVTCPEDQLVGILGSTPPDGLWLAAHNAPDQVVLAGGQKQLQHVEQEFTARGLSVTRLQTSGAFHTPAVAAAAEPFGAVLDRIDVRPLDLDVWSNVTADRYPREPSAIRELVGAQMTSPVRFAAQVQAMYADGVRVFIELGAGGTLSGLVSRGLGDRAHLAVRVDVRATDACTSLYDALAALAVHAARPIDFEALWTDHAPLPDLERRKPRMRMPIGGNNVGRFYPPPAQEEPAHRADSPPTLAVSTATCHEGTSS
ncbi:beta-ketoacyl synthase N-terminal-like domain-containing protein [Streptomyces longwoodensis]|uniref:beta-ketoacyl synthase N-terminal-like domain-containing protein n=1 Tax=Streptomyces longwoodensis TaxID=68231 RepID=UPI00340E2ADA